MSDKVIYLPGSIGRIIMLGISSTLDLMKVQVLSFSSYIYKHIF